MKKRLSQVGLIFMLCLLMFLLLFFVAVIAWNLNSVSGSRLLAVIAFMISAFWILQAYDLLKRQKG
jgi:hypothetical protein